MSWLEGKIRPVIAKQRIVGYFNQLKYSDIPFETNISLLS